MKHVIVLSNTRGLSAPALLVYANQIALAMTNNLNFQNPFPDLNYLQSVINELDVAITNSGSGGKTATAILHAKMHKLSRALKTLSTYVEFISDDEESIALSSGFSVRKKAMRVSLDFKVNNGINHGEVFLKTKSEKNASYIWQYTTDLTGETDWVTSAITMQATCTIKGLTSLQKYRFRVGVVNSKGQQPFGKSVILLVL